MSCCCCCCTLLLLLLLLSESAEGAPLPPQLDGDGDPPAVVADAVAFDSLLRFDPDALLAFLLLVGDEVGLILVPSAKMSCFLKYKRGKEFGISLNRRRWQSDYYWWTVDNSYPSFSPFSLSLFHLPPPIARTVDDDNNINSCQHPPGMIASPPYRSSLPKERAVCVCMCIRKHPHCPLLPCPLPLSVIIVSLIYSICCTTAREEEERRRKK